MQAGTVGWDDDAVAAWPGLAPLDGDRVVDACVVGLGASGLAAVDDLLNRRMSVIGVDAGRVAAGAAGRNGGFLLGGPSAYLHEAIAKWGPEPAVTLYRATLAELDRLVAVLGPQVIARKGSIRLAGLPGPPVDADEEADRAAELIDCARHAAALREHDIAVEEYDGELGQGLFLPDDAATNPARRALALATSLREKAVLHEATAVSTVDGRQVVTDRGVISAGVVIVAVDGRLDVLLPRLRSRVRTARLQMLATTAAPSRLPCPVYGRWGYDYAQQDAEGRIYAGGGRDQFVDAEWTTDATPTPRVQAWIERVATRMAGRSVGVTHRWAASVGYTADGRPLCVQVAPGVVACGGYNGTGNLVGPVTARAAVALAVDGVPPPSWSSA
jgi:gamma-glutamylputrescine oxidase